MIHRSKRNVVLSIMLISLFIVCVLIPYRSVKARSDEVYEKLKIFSEVLSIIQKNYVEEITPENLIYGSINGMLRTLDPHSSFMPPDVYKELQVETKGSFGGIGIEITIKEGVLTIISPIEDTPAFRAGLKAGDSIVKIDGVLTENMSLFDAVKKMRGLTGTKVTISIMREGFTEPQEFALSREIIRITSVKHKLLEESIGYLRISQFQEKTEEEFSKALDTLEKGTTPLTGLILDLRNNPGGLLDQAVKVCDEFLEQGLIVYTQGRNEMQQMKFTATPNKKPHSYPLIVLVNAGSASGSEIVAGALQDHNRAVIVGTTTFGKGSVQTIIPLEDGSGLRLTTARYYTPRGTSIQAKGIIPDVVVKEGVTLKKDEKKETKMIKEKDLEGHFEPEEKAKEASVTDNEETDMPLARAVQLLKGWHILKGSENHTQPTTEP
jgi:carboxyl-terminal processing protease